MEEALAVRQARFVQEYLIDLNATQAAIRSGYSKNGANVTGSQLLANPNIQDEIQRAMEKRGRKLELSADKVLRELSYLGFSNMMDYILITEDGDAYTDLSRITREQAAAIQEITVEEYTEGRGEDARNIRKTKLKLTDKTKNLELIGKHLGIFGEGFSANNMQVIINANSIPNPGDPVVPLPGELTD